MSDGDRGCGPVYGLYAAARSGDVEATRAAWTAARRDVIRLDEAGADRIEAALTAGDTAAVATRTAAVLLGGPEPTRLDGLAASVVGTLLYWFGYVASFVLFFRARTPPAVVARLRWAYRTVGVDIRDTETVDGTARTVFRCPYRNLGARRYGRRRVCHDVLDRVDDGYVTFLDRHRGIDYDRPRACAASECCYSEVTAR